MAKNKLSLQALRANLPRRMPYALRRTADGSVPHLPPFTYATGGVAAS